MSFTANVKKKLPTEDETRIKFLSIAYNINCYEPVKKLFKQFDGLSAKYRKDANARVQLVEDLILNLYKIDVRLVGWLLDDNGRICVNGHTVLQLNQDSQMKDLYV